MPLSLVALSAAASFACLNPTHHDGDNMRCSNVAETLRLQGIDAPEMPGACRPGRRCVEGDPDDARDYLRSLTAGRNVQCVQADTDRYGRAIVNCTADGQNISCAMIAAGKAVPRYAALDCSAGTATPADQAGSAVADATTQPAPPASAPAPIIVPAQPSAAAPTAPPTRGALLAGVINPAMLVLAGLLLINLTTWGLFAIDKRRAQAGRARERIAESTLLGWAALGGSPAAWHAISRLRHKSSKQSFRLRLLLISGVQAGMAIGAAWLWIGS